MKRVAVIFAVVLLVFLISCQPKEDVSITLVGDQVEFGLRTGSQCEFEIKSDHGIELKLVEVKAFLDGKELEKVREIECEEDIVDKVYKKELKYIHQVDWIEAMALAGKLEVELFFVLPNILIRE